MGACLGLTHTCFPIFLLNQPSASSFTCKYSVLEHGSPLNLFFTYKCSGPILGVPQKSFPTCQTLFWLPHCHTSPTPLSRQWSLGVQWPRWPGAVYLSIGPSYFVGPNSSFGSSGLDGMELFLYFYILKVRERGEAEGLKGFFWNQSLDISFFFF